MSDKNVSGPVQKRIEEAINLLLEQDEEFSIDMGGPDLSSMTPADAYQYAKEVIRGRWPEAESYIMRDPHWAYSYAKDVMRDRWPEAEPHIMQDPAWAYMYALDVIKGRWPEGEDAIKQNAWMAMLYAVNITKERWPEAEVMIMWDEGAWDDYVEHFDIEEA